MAQAKFPKTQSNKLGGFFLSRGSFCPAYVQHSHVTYKAIIPGIIMILNVNNHRGGELSISPKVIPATLPTIRQRIMRIGATEG